MKKIIYGLLAFSMFSTMSCKQNDNDPVPVDTTDTTSKIVTLSGDISANTTLSASKKYLLKGFVYVKSGVTLTIEPGTVITGDKASKGTLVITRGAKIHAEGTASKPIIFTSSFAAGARSQGDWGGLILLGKAPINPADKEAKIEGGLTPTSGGNEKDYIWYGGSDVNDNSGILKYVRIEFAGTAFTPDNEINGLTMGGVGAGTTIDYVQVYRSGDDAFEWFGGTVNCKHLIASYTWDDDFDTDFGFSGKIQFGLAQRVKTIADVSGSNGFESDNDANGSVNEPKTKSVFSNMTIVGPITAGNSTSGINANFQHGAQIRRNSSQSIYNSIFVGFPIGLYIDDSKGTATSLNAEAGTLKFMNNIIAGCPTKFKSASTWSGAAAWYAATATTELANAEDALLMDPNKFSAAVSTPNGTPNFLLKAGSPALTGAMAVAGMDNVSYRGAFDGTNDWTSGWATWSAENTEY
ncbi:MAG TPA: hypothetical protein VL098_02810 [Flavipsychrobacter sp.]|nr:hypothetical protein [Flavipsychrobacter sp.]